MRDGCGFRNYKPHPAPMTLFIVGELGALGSRTGFRKADLYHKSIAAAFWVHSYEPASHGFNIFHFPRQLFRQQQEDPCNGAHEQQTGGDSSGRKQRFPGRLRKGIIGMLQDSQHAVVSAGAGNETDDTGDYEHGGGLLESSGEDIAEEPHKAGGYECRQYR